MAPLLVDVSGTNASHAVVVAVVSPVFVLLCWIRSFRYLAFTSILGDVAFCLAMGTSCGVTWRSGVVPLLISSRLPCSVWSTATVFWWGFENLPDPEFDRPAFELSSYPSFIGSAVFLYGICLFVRVHAPLRQQCVVSDGDHVGQVMPVQQGMEKPSQFMPSVYASFTFTTILNVLFGAVGYALWGNTAQVA